MLPGPPFFPEMMDGAWPSSLREGFDAHFCIQNVLPEGIDVVCVGHQCPQPNNGNRLEGTLLNPFARFAVFGCQRHGFTSIHDALWNHGDGVACVNVDALPRYTGRQGTCEPKGRTRNIVLIDVSP